MPVDDQNACTEDICEAGAPKNVPLAAGAACENNNKVCDGAGNCVECVVDSDCSSPDTCGGGGMPNVCGCQETSCADQGVTCGTTPNTCGGGMMNCNDGAKNGTETDVDCGGGGAGGTCSVKCDQGKLCLAGADCKSNECTDGFCCNNACDQPCKACNVTGKEGTCDNLPQLTEDPGVCEGTMACDGNGGCKLALGEACNGDGDCASGKCMNNTCVN